MIWIEGSIENVKKGNWKVEDKSLFERVDVYMYVVCRGRERDGVFSHVYTKPDNNICTFSRY